MKKFLNVAMVLMMALVLTIPVFSTAERVNGHSEMWVNTPNGKCLNVRERPDKSEKIIYCVECGTKLNILEETDSEWARVYADGQEKGYVMMRFLVAEKPGKYEMTERNDDFRAVNPYKVTALPRSRNSKESVGLRVKPNKRAKMIRRLRTGNTLTVIAVGRNWSKVKDARTGKTGYVANDYITRK